MPDQVGLAEMKPVVDMSGGMVVMTDTFTNPVFKESFKRVFAPAGDPGCLDIASNATFEARCARPSRAQKFLGNPFLLLGFSGFRFRFFGLWHQNVAVWGSIV